MVMKTAAIPLSVPSFCVHIRRRTVLCFLAVLLLSAQAASGTGADFAAIDLTAAAPYTYGRSTGGGAYNDGTVGDYYDIANSLQGAQFECGQIIFRLL